MNTRAIILVGHGSRDPLWRQPIEAVHASVRARAPAVPVRCAYLEWDTPDLPTVIDELVQQGVGAIEVIPLFLGTGRHAREDMPRLIAAATARHPQLQLNLRRATGEEPQVIELLAKMALE